MSLDSDVIVDPPQVRSQADLLAGGGCPGWLSRRIVASV